MKLPLHIAAKLLLLQQLEKLPASSLKHEVVDELLQEGLLQKQMQGRGRTYLFAPSAAALAPYLHNRFGINDLQAYVQTMQSNTTNRSALVEATSNSKTKRLRSFTGFMVATPEPMNVTLNHQPVTLLPHPGLFTYVADYANFEVPADVTIVGVENAENFNNLPQ
ncbi:MAG: hypothetical protein LH478_14870, partial [Chitinophagaceae bacterium]|nr:hypothetical protein [Chitinophagaceae bacterium]